MSDIHIVIMAKTPIPGLVKTRLSPLLGEEGSATLATYMLRYTIEQAFDAQLGSVELCVDSTLEHSFWKTFKLDSRLIFSQQSCGNLGNRLADASRRVSQSKKMYLFIGTDCLALNANKLQEAASLLREVDACMIPTFDGGYALLGLHRHHDQLFNSIPWSTEFVAALTRQRVHELNWSLNELEPLHDIDEPRDLQWVPKAWLHEAEKKH